jgi:hypothetical protein
MSNLMHNTRFLNNIHEVRSKERRLEHEIYFFKTNKQT